jgi:hypothetical protein
LESCLARDADALPYAEIGAQLDLTEAAVKTAMQRLRARYQAILREEIGKTVASPDDVELDNGFYPSGNNGLRDLIRQPVGASNWHGPCLKTIPKDPW